jgi:L-ornithine N5-oxygenase
VLGDYRSVAHSGVSFDLLSQMYGSYYTDLVSGRQALRIDRFVELVAAADEDHAARAVYRHLHTGEQVEVEADAVILCTGYRYVMPLPMLAGVQEHLEMKSPDQYALERHYSIARRDGFRPGIYLQGYGELTHGFSEVLLSLMPHRAAEITADVATGLTREAVL